MEESVIQKCLVYKIEHLYQMLDFEVCCALTVIFDISNISTLRSVCFAYFYSVMKYGVIGKGCVCARVRAVFFFLTVNRCLLTKGNDKDACVFSPSASWRHAEALI
jgi:hypothetical protein